MYQYQPQHFLNVSRMFASSAGSKLARGCTLHRLEPGAIGQSRPVYPHNHPSLFVSIIVIAIIAIIIIIIYSIIVIIIANIVVIIIIVVIVRSACVPA